MQIQFLLSALFNYKIIFKKFSLILNLNLICVSKKARNKREFN